MRSVGFVQLNSTLSWKRQRFMGRARRRGLAAFGGPVDSGAPESWSIFPYSVGLLEAYVRRHAGPDEAYAFRPPIFRDDAPAAELATRLRGADVVGFSAYVWNERRSLALAAELKRLSPSTLVVFGGPQVPDRPTRWLPAHPQVDVAVHGEGEAVFLEVLREAGRGRWGSLPSVSFRDGADVVTTPRRPRIADLDAIPSPYLTGVFEPLIDAGPDDQWLMLWETNRGCPFSCAFCDWGSATASKVHRFAMDRLEAELDWFGALGGELIFCCDANFGILPRDVELARAAAAAKARHGYPRTLSVQNTKNATDRAYEVHTILGRARMHAGVTMALQSLDAATLEAVGRKNISLESFRELQRRLRRDGIPTYTDVILSLPGESYDTFADGISRLIAEGQHDRIQFYNCSILPNAPMADPDYRATWGLETVPQRLLAHHASLDEPDDGERIQTVVATRHMPRDDWRRAKVLWWYTDLLHYDRLLALPFVVAHGTGGVPYRAMIEAVMDADPSAFPELGRIRARLDAHAAAVQDGAPEPLPSEAWLGLWWPADQWVLAGLVTRFATDAFYREAEIVIGALLARLGWAGDDVLLREAFRLNRALLAQPFEIDDAPVELERDVMAAYDAILAGRPLPAAAPAVGTVIRTRPTWLSWDGWFEHLTFCHNQKSAYLWPWRRQRARVPV